MSNTRAVLGSIVRPKPFIKKTAIPGLAKQFNDPAFCRRFVEDISSASQSSMPGHRPDPFEFMELMMKARTPLGKQIVKNILLYGREQGDLGLPDGNLTRTTKLIGGLPKAARKDVLAKPWMVHDLVDERDYNWNDKAVMKWLCEYKRADRLDILRADAAIEGLIIEGEDAIAINRPQVKKWFDKESDAGKAKMLEGCRAGQAFITAFGAEGLELVKRYVPVEKRGGVIVDRSTILFTIEEAVFVDYVRSLPLSQRADYTKPDARYYTPNKDPKIPPSTLTGPALQARL